MNTLYPILATLLEQSIQNGRISIQFLDLFVNLYDCLPRHGFPSKLSRKFGNILDGRESTAEF